MERRFLMTVKEAEDKMRAMCDELGLTSSELWKDSFTVFGEWLGNDWGQIADSIYLRGFGHNPSFRSRTYKRDANGDFDWILIRKALEDRKDCLSKRDEHLKEQKQIRKVQEQARRKYEEMVKRAGKPPPQMKCVWDEHGIKVTLCVKTEEHLARLFEWIEL
jgi:hypothetical protein